MTCDERRTIAYLAGDLDDNARAAFERHLLGCETCWSDVRDDRRGRELAEQLRELAPSGLRDRIRANVELAAGSRVRPRRRFVTVGLAAAALAIVAAGSTFVVLNGSGDPPVVAEVLHMAKATEPLPAHAHATLDGKPVALSRYEFEGTTLVLARSSARFPMPDHAMALGGKPGEPWVAKRGGMTLLCLSNPDNVLLAGHLPPSRLLVFAHAMGLAP